MKLYADPGYWEVSKETRESWGCGPGGFGDYFVPDTAWGLSIKPACMIHDWYYRCWPIPDESQREVADRIFLNNMLRIIMAAGGRRFLIKLRIKRAHTYFQMVRKFGGPAWWEERNNDKEYQNA